MTVTHGFLKRRYLAALLVLTAIGAAAGEPAEAARAPVGRTYYTVIVGLETGYDIGAQCLEFHQQRLCSLDGLVCGSWRATAGLEREMELSFELRTVVDGDLMRMEGMGRLDTRGRKSSLAGTGRIAPVEGEGRGANFSFAGRAAGTSECLDLLEDAAGGDDGTVVVGSGNVVTEEREVGQFHGLVASGVGLIEIRHGATDSLHVTADDNILPLLTSETRNGRLHVASAGRFRTENDIRFDITVRELDELTLAGVFGVDATGIDTELFEVDVSGVSAVTVSGRAERQKVTVAGVSRYDARDLESRAVEIDITGPSWAVVRASDTLRGSVSGGGVLEYYGDPSVDVAVDFISTLSDIG